MPGDRVEIWMMEEVKKFIDGEFIDVCLGTPCHAAGWTGP